MLYNNDLLELVITDNRVKEIGGKVRIIDEDVLKTNSTKFSGIIYPEYDTNRYKYCGYVIYVTTSHPHKTTYICLILEDKEENVIVKSTSILKTEEVKVDLVRGGFDEKKYEFVYDKYWRD